MRKYWLSPKTMGFVLPLLVGAALQLGGWLNHTIAYILFGLAFVWAILALIRWLKSRKQGDFTNDKIQPKFVVGGLIGSSSAVKLTDCHFKGKIIIHGKSEDIKVGGLIGQAENTEVVDSSADAEIQYKQD